MRDGVVTSDVSSMADVNRRRWALLVVLVGQFMLVLDTSIVSIALRAIQADLGLGAAQLTWVTTAYLIAFGGLLLLFGRLSDLLGRRRIFLLGLWIFTLASVACGIATSPLALIAARFIQGIGAAAASSVTLAIIAVEYPDPTERVRAMSAYSLVSVCGGSAGLLVGGLLTATTTWHSIFLINVPIGLVAIRLGSAFLREDEVPEGVDRSIDVTGAVLATSGAMALIWALVALADKPFQSIEVALPAAVAALCLGAFAIVETRVRNPLVPPRIVQIRSLMVASIVRACACAALYGAWFMGALEMGQALGFGPMAVGLAFLPQTLTVAILSLGPTSKLIARFGARAVLLFGLSAMAAATWSLSMHTPGAGYWPWRFLSYFVMGVGGGTTFLPLVVLAMRDVPKLDAGLGSGIVNVSQQLAAALGLAVLGSIAAYRTKALVMQSVPVLDALIEGFHTAYEAAAVCLLLGLVVLVVFWRARHTEPTTESHRAITAE